MNHTSDWPFSRFVCSFIYYYIVNRLKTNNYALTSYDWKVILRLSLNPQYSTEFFDVLKRNRFTRFSKTEGILDGAVVSLNLSTNCFDFRKQKTKYELSRSLENLLYFLQVPEKSVQPVIDSVFIDKNTTKIQKFLRNHKWGERHEIALRDAT